MYPRIFALLTRGTVTNSLKSLAATESKIWVGFAVALICCGAIGTVAWLTVARQHDDALWVEHTHTTINRLESLFAVSADAQDSYRGYVLTGDESVLQPYLEALQAAPPALRELQALVRDNPGQVRRAAAVSSLVTELLDHGRVVVQARRAQGVSDPRRQVTPGPGELFTMSSVPAFWRWSK